MTPLQELKNLSLFMDESDARTAKAKMAVAKIALDGIIEHIRTVGINGDV